MSDEEHGLPETSHSNYLLSIVGAVGSLLLFALVIFIAYLPNRPEPVNAQIVENRLNNLAELEAKQTEQASTYGWINQKDGVVRIPISQAMDIASTRLAKGKPAFAAAEPQKPDASAADKPSPQPAAEKPAEEKAKSGASPDETAEAESAEAEKSAEAK